ncbi:hypothetical protein Ae201684P_013849 [Aphanomyces euteiches]|nr:hypothetical protein Ae201684P_013849 [Aphanomyces euteiches]KAH9145981.1 hypothetical protein AeRB84_010152 [Aphanomyces euteiches]
MPSPKAVVHRASSTIDTSRPSSWWKPWTLKSTTPLKTRTRQASLPSSALPTLDLSRLEAPRPRAFSSRDATSPQRRLYCETCAKSFATRDLFDRHHAFSFLHKLAVHQEEDESTTLRRIMHIVHVESKSFWRLRRSALVVIAQNDLDETAIGLDSVAAIEIVVVSTSKLVSFLPQDTPFGQAVAKLVEVGCRDVKKVDALGIVLPGELSAHIASSLVEPDEFSSIFACFDRVNVDAHVMSLPSPAKTS